MNLHKTRHSAIAPTLVIATALLLGNPSFAEVIPFRVVFESVPGSEEMEAGNIQAGIEVLEDQLNQVEQGDGGDMLATLRA